MRRHLAASLVAVALLAAGCKNDFAPQSDLLGLRVLALVADRPELAPGQSITITPTDFVPGTPASTKRSWSFCPFTVGAVTAYACAVPACEVPLPDGATVTANPTELIAACLPNGRIPPGLPEPVNSVFRYQITTVTDGVTATREAILQVPQWLYQVPTNPNLPPVIQKVLVGGTQVWPVTVPPAVPPYLPPNGTLPVELVIDPASVQTFVDAAGLTQTETMTGYFYTTGGTIPDGITTGVDTTTNLEGTGFLPGQTSAQVWVVALDLRGGQAVAGPFTVPFGP
jgi:hypothetical protein